MTANWCGNNNGITSYSLDQPGRRRLQRRQLPGPRRLLGQQRRLGGAPGPGLQVQLRVGERQPVHADPQRQDRSRPRSSPTATCPEGCPRLHGPSRDGGPCSRVGSSRGAIPPRQFEGSCLSAFFRGYFRRQFRSELRRLHSLNCERCSRCTGKAATTPRSCSCSSGRSPLEGSVRWPLRMSWTSGSSPAAPGARPRQSPRPVGVTTEDVLVPPTRASPAADRPRDADRHRPREAHQRRSTAARKIDDLQP